MKKLVSYALCALLVTAMVPAQALAVVSVAIPDGFDGLVFTQAGEQAITLGSDDLYTAVTEQLSAKSINFEGDDATRSVTLDASQVTELDISNKYLNTLEGIGSFTSLTKLNIANNDLHKADLSPLGSLVNLTHLDMHGNHLSTIGPVGGLANLTWLDASRNELVDSNSTHDGCIAQQVSGLAKLTWLDLSHNLLRYTDGLGNLARLEYLDLYDNAVRDLSGLADPAGSAGGNPRLSTSLAHLDLGDNNETNSTTMTGLEALDALTSLTYLDFSRNQTSAIMDHVGNKVNLTFLQLQGNGISDVSNLASLVNLETLILSKNNRFADISPLLGLSNLKELDLTESVNASTAHMEDVVTSDGLLAWPQLRKLNIMRAWAWNGWNKTTDKLVELDKQGALQLEYDWRFTSVAYQQQHFSDDLVKTDGDVLYVTYDDFGARCNGSYDDYFAMLNAHDFANRYQAAHPEAHMEVRATAGKTYHVFAPYNTDWYPIETDVDWKGATIVVHDEDIENKPARNNILFVVRTLDGGAAYDAHVNTAKDGITVDCTVDASYQAGAKLPRELVDLFPDNPATSGKWSRYYVQLFNADHPQHIRSGDVNANAGEAMYDGVVASADGTLEDDIQWDFEKLTKVIIIPIPERTGHIRNANFVHTGIRSKSEVSYYRGGGKTMYYYRNFQTQYMANIDISGITHRLGAPDDYTQSWDELSGSYYGIFYLQYSADVTFRDSTLFGPRYCDGARSSYDLCYGMNTNITFSNVNASTGTSKDHRWSVISGHGAKDVLYENCTTNSAGTHQTVYNFTVRNCTLNSITLCGQGLALIENTSVETQYFVNLRSDYGTTWNGPMRIINCTHHYNANNRPSLIYTTFDKARDGTIWKYGYDTHFPDVYVENLTVDYAKNNLDRDYCRMNGPYYIAYNAMNYYTPGQDPYTYVPTSYWSNDIVVNGVTFENAQAQIDRGSTPEVRLTATDQSTIGEGKEARNYLITGVRVSSGDDDVTTRLFAGESPALAGPVSLSLARTPNADETYALSRDGEEVEKGSLGEKRNLTLADAGTYELKLTSTSAQHGWKGARTIAFTVKGEKPGGTPDKEDPIDPSDPGGRDDLGDPDDRDDSPDPDDRNDQPNSGNLENPDDLDEKHDPVSPSDPSEGGGTVNNGASDTASPSWARHVIPVRPVYALRAAKSGNWIYVASAAKATSLARGKWRYRGIAFYAPASGGKKVYVLRNVKTGARRYTTSAANAKSLKAKGWKRSTAPFQSTQSGTAIYLMYNKKAKTYRLAKGSAKAATLKKRGWKSKGIALRCI